MVTYSGTVKDRKIHEMLLERVDGLGKREVYVVRYDSNVHRIIPDEGIYNLFDMKGWSKPAKISGIGFLFEKHSNLGSEIKNHSLEKVLEKIKG